MSNKKIIFDDASEDEDDFEENFSSLEKWYEELTPDPETFEPVSQEQITALEKEAKQCYESFISGAKQNDNTTMKWIHVMKSQGTSSDKIAALTVLIQSDPIHNLYTLKTFMDMLNRNQKLFCEVIGPLTELFLKDLLRPNIKLKKFDKRPLSKLSVLSSGNESTRKKYLVYWYFEDQLKEYYRTFVELLITLSMTFTTDEGTKMKIINSLAALFQGNPELEGRLLESLINKFGDSNRQVDSKVLYVLQNILEDNRNMQMTVLLEVEKFIFRNNLPARAQFYSLCFLTGFYFSADTERVANKAVKIYFTFFKKCISTGEVDSRIMSALIIGLRRAYPYSKLDESLITEHKNTLYRMVYNLELRLSLNILTFLYHVDDTNRFYVALYHKLMDPKIDHRRTERIFLQLVFKSMLRDQERPRVLAFVKRLLQVAFHTQTNFTCGILMLVSEVITRKKGLNALTLHTCEESETVEEKSVKSADTVQLQNNLIENDKDKNENELFIKSYDMLKWNPLYTGAQFSAYVELLALKTHFHPTVRMFTETIISSKRIYNPGDPLIDFSLQRFLDRFSFKNPTKPPKDEKIKINRTFGVHNIYNPKGEKSIPVGTKEYADLQNVPVDELFLHNYVLKKNLHQGPNDDDNASVASEEFLDMLGNMPEYRDLDINYLNDVDDTKLKKKQNKKSKHKPDDVDDDDDNDDDDIDEDNLSEDSFGDEFDNMGSDEGEMEFDHSDDEMDSGIPKKKSKRGKGVSFSSLFADAEQFSSVIEDEGHAAYTPGLSDQVRVNKKAGAKQLKWENERSWEPSQRKNRGNFKFDKKNRKQFGKQKGGFKKW